MVRSARASLVGDCTYIPACVVGGAAGPIQPRTASLTELIVIRRPALLVGDALGSDWSQGHAQQRDQAARPARHWSCAPRRRTHVDLSVRTGGARRAPYLRYDYTLPRRSRVRTAGRSRGERQHRRSLRRSRAGGAALDRGGRRSASVRALVAGIRLKRSTVWTRRREPSSA